MVLYDNKKYACETCVKGHRVSTCNHTDRALFEIQKKGRPATQCDHCRELRKTKQVHVKCMCEMRDNEAEPPTAKKGIQKILEKAAFPYGLPDIAVLDSPALHVFADHSSSDSDHNGDCSCKSGDACHCCVPRKRPTKPRTNYRFAFVQSNGDAERDFSSIPQSHATSDAEASKRYISLTTPVQGHRPSAMASRSVGRLYSHDYSPYSRAYNDHFIHYNPSPLSSPSNSVPSPVASPIDPHVVQATFSSSSSDVPIPTEITVPSPVPSSVGSAVVCNCGPGVCGCAGCQQRADGQGNKVHCLEPDECKSCLDCVVTSMAMSTNETVSDTLPDNSVQPGLSSPHQSSSSYIPSSFYHYPPTPTSDASLSVPSLWGLYQTTMPPSILEDPVAIEDGPADSEALFKTGTGITNGIDSFEAFTNQLRSEEYPAAATASRGFLVVPELGRSRSSSSSSSSSASSGFLSAPDHLLFDTKDPPPVPTGVGANDMLARRTVVDGARASQVYPYTYGVDAGVYHAVEQRGIDVSMVQPWIHGIDPLLLPDAQSLSGAGAFDPKWSTYLPPSVENPWTTLL